MTLIVILGILLLIALFVMATYNSLVTLRNRVRNAYSQMDVQMKNRADLIPALVETVKGAAGHERGTLEAVTRARQQVMDARTPEDAMAANNEMTSALSRLMVVVEQYPQLKADQNFRQLMTELKDAEEKIRYSRQFYNDTVQMYNTRIQVFPANFVAGMFGFGEERFFEISDSERQAPTVDFSGIYGNTPYGNPGNPEVTPGATPSAPNTSGIQENMSTRNHDVQSQYRQEDGMQVNPYPETATEDRLRKGTAAEDPQNNPAYHNDQRGIGSNPGEITRDAPGSSTNSNNPNDPATRL